MRYRWVVGTAAAALGVGGAAGTLAPVFGSTVVATVPSYRLTGSGTGMRLTMAGHTIVAATSTVSASSGAGVAAAASGELTPAAVLWQRAAAGTRGASETKAQECAAHPSSSFPAPFSTAVTLEAACSAASAAESSSGTPSATATGSVSRLAIAPPSGGATSASALRALLPTNVAPNSPLASALAGVLGPLPSLPQSGLPLATVVQQVAAHATGSTVTTFAAATLGPSTSTIGTSGGSLGVQSVDTGATTALLGGAGAGGGPLLTVDVGKAVAAARIDQATGQVTESATAASVTVSVAPPAGTAQTVSVTPGLSRSFFTGTPLQTTIALSAPSTTATSGRASASGVTVDLGQATGAVGGVELDLGAASVQASAAPPATAPSTPRTASDATATSGPSPALTGATTVHTGEPWSGPLPIALLAMSLLAGVGLLARRHLSGFGQLVGRAAGRLVHPRGR